MSDFIAFERINIYDRFVQKRTFIIFVQFLDHFFINIATNLTVTYKPCTFSILILQLTMQYKSIVVLGKFFFLHCFSLSCFNWVSTYKFTVWCPIYGNLMNPNCLHGPSEFGDKNGLLRIHGLQ